MQGSEESAGEKDDDLFLSVHFSTNEILIPLTTTSNQVGKHTKSEFNQAFPCLQSSKRYAW